MKQITIDHHIQRTIMKALMAAPDASFSALKPAGIESNLFLYHLRQLIRAGLVEKDDKVYRLSVLGKQYLDRTNLDTMITGMQPKVVTIQVIQKADGDYVFLERLHQPFIGLQGFPSGKVHFGETLTESAYRELTAKTGLTAEDVSLTLRGNIIMRFHSPKTQAIANHVVAYVLAGELKAGRSDVVQPHDKTLYRTFWGALNSFESDRAIKGHAEIVELLKGDGYFIESYDFESSY